MNHRKVIGILMFIALGLSLYLIICQRPARPDPPASAATQQTNSMPQQYTGQSLPFSYPKDTSASTSQPE